MRRFDVLQEQGDSFLYIGPSQSISQSFIPHKNNLSSIRFSVFNHKLGGARQYELRILDESLQEVRKEIITESNLGWAQTFRYDFSPLPDSGGKLYTFELSYLGKNQEAEIYLSQINKDMLGMKVLFSSSDKAETYRNDFMKISYAKEDEYPEGKAFINGEAVDGDIKFQTYYSTTPKGFLIDSLTDFSKRVTYDKPFILTFIFLLSALSLILFMRLFLKKYSGRT